MGVRQQMQREMDAEGMKMYEIQERSQSNLSKLSVFEQSNKKQMSEIHALKMRLIESDQKFENIKSEKQSLLSQVHKLEAQMEHGKNLKASQQHKMKAMQDEIKMNREKAQFQFALMEKRYKQRLNTMQSELD